MKLYIPVLLLAVIFSGSAFAGGLSVGLLAGVDLADLTSDSLEENESLTTFTAGAFLDVPVTPSITIRPEVLYVMGGTKWGEGEEELMVDLTYLDVPILVRYNIPMAGSLAPVVFAGPYFGLNIGAEVDFGGVIEDIKDDIASMDYGLVAGAGVKLPAGMGDVSLDAQYMLGLANIDDTDAEEVIKNSGILFLLGYGFSL